MRRGAAVAAMLAAFAVGLLASHGCVDDRAKVRASIFFCNPASRTADADCGKGFMCYGAAQSLGGSICVPTCDPAQPDTTCPGGLCTMSGACLSRCTVPPPGQPDPCPSPLLCMRTTISPLESAAGNDGVCLPLNNACSNDNQCISTSPVFTSCTSSVDGASDGPGLLTAGSVCVQGGCGTRGVGCNPGSACVRAILPPEIPAPDVCSPICTPARDRGDMGTFNECLPTLTCLSDAFPQTDAPACAPGFPGWLCVDDHGCTAGSCYDWGDVAPDFTGFKTCAPSCKTDDDCVPFDRGGNPTFMTRNVCHDGKCRNFSSMFFPLTCIKPGPHCKLDSEASCVSTVPDMGMVPQMGLGAFGGAADICVHGCTAKSDCTDVAKRLHVPMTCGTINNFTACVPMIPYFIECKSDGDCFGDLTCQSAPTQNGQKNVCTRTCMSSQECADDPALGSTFACVGGLCAPKAPSGTVGVPLSDACLSGQLQGTPPNSKCVSPTGWACTSNDQCANGQCVILGDTDPPYGRCN